MNLRVRNLFPLLLSLVLIRPAFGSPATCSNATLQGSFGFVLSGKNIALSGDYVLVGRFDADGKGGYQGNGSQSANGRVAHGAFSGTYTVNADCSGTAQIVFADTGLKDKLDFVLVADGTELYLIDMGGKTVEYGEAKKLFRGKKSHS